jgi:hypothetical protein
MLSKLIRHEFRATMRVMLPLYLIVLALSVGMNFSFRGMFDTPFKLLNILGGLLATAFFVAIAAVCIMSIVVMIQRFYKNLLQDEGYVMLTLPVSVHQQIWSKLIVSVVWIAATVLVVILSACIATFNVSVIQNLWQDIQAFVSYMTADMAFNGAAFVVEGVVLAFLTCCALCLRFYAALSVGHSFANHKMAWSVLFFFVFQFVVQFLASAVVTFGDVSGLDYTLTQLLLARGTAGIHVTMLLLIVSVVCYGAVFYLVTARFLQKHLNLE